MLYVYLSSFLKRCIDIFGIFISVFSDFYLKYQKSYFCQNRQTSFRLHTQSKGYHIFPGISIKLRIDYRALKEYDSADKMKEGICMEVSLLLMEQIAQLFIVLLMGYIVVKAKLLKPSDSKVLSVVLCI